MNENNFDVIIIGGSYSGLAAGMALGRALRKVLIIDSGKPCNRQTPHSHNFLTHDGKTPTEIATVARSQVEAYDTVRFISAMATQVDKTENGFAVQLESGASYQARKIILATGISDILLPIDGFKECWGISVLHCPYCHGYEVRDQPTGVLGNGQKGYEFASLISNWAKTLTLFTNGSSTLTAEQVVKLRQHSIAIVEKEIESLDHDNGRLHRIVFRDWSASPVGVLYAPRPFEQHSTIPAKLGCEFSEEGYIKISPAQKTSIEGVFACGDNATRMRTVIDESF